ncbi:hypothetical protein [Okeania sp.]|uniref:hypothetical protein n=1 Tax=Okeania sp. TaxID=3100323 RepID=UPI002B4B7F20|nr:hypothetical protein [Okeania sp.]MEB3343494.1 hypothetical protein [Okeania sp.]
MIQKYSKKLQGTSIQERILVIEAVLQTVKNDMGLTSSQQLSSEEQPLKGKVINYDAPYEPIALQDWETLK